MTTIEIFIYKHLNTLRRIVQIATILLVVAIPILNHLGNVFLIGTFYSINIGDLVIADPAMVLQTILLHKQFYLPLIMAGAIPIIITLLFGRVFCSWMCPQNTLSELVDWIRRKVARKSGSKKGGRKNPKTQYYWFAFGVIVTTVMISGIPLVGYLSAPGIISSSIADIIFIGTFGWEILLIGLILLTEFVFFRRAWCKYLCPVGATLALFRYKHSMKVHYEASRCTCGIEKSLCQEACQFQLNPKRKGIYPYCHNCGACIDACRQEGGALTFTFVDEKCPQRTKSLRDEPHL